MKEQQQVLCDRILPSFQNLKNLDGGDPLCAVSAVVLECTGGLNREKLVQMMPEHQRRGANAASFFGSVSNRDVIQRSFYFSGGTEENVRRYLWISQQAGRLIGNWVTKFVSSEAIDPVANDAAHCWMRVLSELAWSEHPRFPIHAEQTFWPQQLMMSPLSQDFAKFQSHLGTFGPWLKPIQQETDPAAMHTVIGDVVQASIYAIDVLTQSDTTDAIPDSKGTAAMDDGRLQCCIRVDKDKGVVFIKDEPYPLVGAEQIKHRVADFVARLIDADGEYIARPREIRTRDLEMQANEVRDLIDAQPGAGSRIPQAKLRLN